MLTAKPWRLEAILRLLASVFICICAGSLAASVLNFFQQGAVQGRSKLLAAAISGALCLAGALWLLRRAWTAENVVRRAAVFLALFYAGLLLGARAQSIAGHAEPTVGQLIIGTLSFQGAGLVLIARFLREHHVSGTEAFGYSQGGWRVVWIGVLIALLFLPLGRALWWASSQIITHVPTLELKPETQQVVQTLQTASSWASRFWLGAVAVLLAPAAEEMLFRGILYPAIKQAGYPRLALWGTSMLFAAMHVNLVAFIPLLALALVLTALYERTGNLLGPIVAHTLFNALNFALVFLPE